MQNAFVLCVLWLLAFVSCAHPSPSASSATMLSSLPLPGAAAGGRAPEAGYVVASFRAHEASIRMWFRSHAEQVEGDCQKIDFIEVSETYDTVAFFFVCDERDPPGVPNARALLASPNARGLIRTVLEEMLKRNRLKDAFVSVALVRERTAPVWACTIATKMSPARPTEERQQHFCSVASEGPFIPVLVNILEQYSASVEEIREIAPPETPRTKPVKSL